MFEFIINSEEEMGALAAELAPILQIKDVVLLKGDLGAGKTFFARHLINHLLDKKEEVPSPTFTLLQIYTTKYFDIYHFDLYRLKDASEVFELGIEDAFDYGVSIIEWPDIIEKMLPKNILKIEISIMPDEKSRKLCINFYNPDKLKSICEKYR